jgi:hypothetical protein
MLVPQCELKYIDEARALFSERFPTGRFEDPYWDVTHFRKSQHRRTNARIYFTEYRSTIDPLPPRFGNIVKACVLLVDDVVASMPLRVDGFRMLWEALKVRILPTQFFWFDLQEVDLLEAEQQMLKHWGESTTEKRCSSLLWLVNSLSATPHGPIVRPLRVAFRTQRQEDFNRYTIAGQELRNAKMPPDESLCAIGDMFYSIVTDESDRLILCLAGILIATGWRGGEAITMPFDCEEIEGSGSNAKYGLRFYKEKEPGGDKYLDVIWLKGSMIYLAKLVVAEARRLTGKARERALVLEQSPDTVLIPNVSRKEILTREKVANLFGRTPQSISSIPHSELKRIPPPWGKEFLFEGGAVMDYLLDRRGPLWSVRLHARRFQSLSETLFIQFRNAGHATRKTNQLLVDCLEIQCVNDFLGGRIERGVMVVKSAFERYEMRDASGEFHGLTSHQFRHWVTTIHAESGTPDHILARWHGRRSVAEVGSYKHLTQEKRLETLKAALHAGRVKGPLATMYFNLKSDVRDEFLEGQLQAIHVTSLGLCVHDWNKGTCRYALNCVKECGDYLLDTANKDHISKLVQLEARTKLTLDQARQQCASGEGECSEQWVAHHEQTLAGTQSILQAAKEAKASIIQPFKGKKSKFRKLE